MRPALHSQRKGARSQRGAALLIAITSIAILTALSLDLAYNTRVSMQVAANARDELRATYLARSAVTLSRLVLHFQQQLDAAGSNVAAALPGAQAGGRLALRLCDLVPVDSSAAALFLGGGLGPAKPASAPPPATPTAAIAAGEGGAAPQEGARRVFGDTEGSFHATIEDEDRKINLRQFDSLGAFPAAQTMRLAQLVREPKWDFLFDQDDANGLRVSRKDVFALIKDWQDVDETSSAFSADPVKPFEAGYGDENYLYQRLPDRYQAKNAPFDSQDELYMLGGFSDAFMAAFGDKLTVYPDKEAKINVNTTDSQELLGFALLMSDPTGVPQNALLDPAFLSKLQEALALARPIPSMSITTKQFAAALQVCGVKVQAIFTQGTTDANKNPFGDQSSTFHIRAVGVAGEVRKTIEAVVTFDRRAEQLAQDQGRLLHWHEE